jgi:hypothetical protein
MGERHIRIYKPSVKQSNGQSTGISPGQHQGQELALKLKPSS